MSRLSSRFCLLNLVCRACFLACMSQKPRMATMARTPEPTEGLMIIASGGPLSLSLLLGGVRVGWRTLTTSVRENSILRSPELKPPGGVTRVAPPVGLRLKVSTTRNALGAYRGFYPPPITLMRSGGTV